MRLLILGTLVIIGGYILWYGITMGMALQSCSTTYQTAIDKARVRVDVLQGDHGAYCQSSYDTIVSWESCTDRAGVYKPPEIASRLRPVLYRLFRATAFPGTRMDRVEAEHDDECKDMTNTMFNPPDMLK